MSEFDKYSLEELETISVDIMTEYGRTNAPQCLDALSYVNDAINRKERAMQNEQQAESKAQGDCSSETSS